jgi:hypothetical protein
MSDAGGLFFETKILEETAVDNVLSPVRNGRNKKRAAL